MCEFQYFWQKAMSVSFAAINPYYFKATHNYKSGSQKGPWCLILRVQFVDEKSKSCAMTINQLYELLRQKFSHQQLKHSCPLPVHVTQTSLSAFFSTTYKKDCLATFHRTVTWKHNLPAFLAAFFWP
jgi:hypothetical protein